MTSPDLKMARIALCRNSRYRGKSARVNNCDEVDDIGYDNKSWEPWEYYDDQGVRHKRM